MPSNSLHSPLSSGEDLFPDGNADLDDVYAEQNHKRAKHKKHKKKHKKQRSSSTHNADDDSCAQHSSRSHRKHKSSKHRPAYDSEEEPFDSRQQQPPPAQPAYANARPPLVAGYEELSDDEELLFKEDRAVSFTII